MLFSYTIVLETQNTEENRHQKDITTQVATGNFNTVIRRIFGGELTSLHQNERVIAVAIPQGSRQ